MTLSALLDSRAPAGIRPGLARMRDALARLGDPQERLRTVHIAGTNGKGSTARMVQAMLTAAGHRAGLYLSPAFPPRAGITLDGAPVPEAALLPLAQTLAALPLEEPLTAFELLTAAVLIYFAQHADIAVVECGMGGLLDATNVCPPPLCAVITPVALDHGAWLGDTVAAIAAHKCGILKGAHPVVAAPRLHPDALATLYAQAAACGATVYQPAPFAGAASHTLEGTRFAYDGVDYTLGLIGAHQIDNALTALTVADRLTAQGIPIPTAARRKGLQMATLPARFEVARNASTSATPSTLILDGAHNPHGMAALAATLEAVNPPRPWTLLLGMLRDKAVAETAGIIAPLCDCVRCATPDSPRALPARELAALVGGAVCDDPAALAVSDGPLLVTGSFYMTKIFSP